MICDGKSMRKVAILDGWWVLFNSLMVRKIMVPGVANRGTPCELHLETPQLLTIYAGSTVLRTLWRHLICIELRSVSRVEGHDVTPPLRCILIGVLDAQPPSNTPRQYRTSNYLYSAVTLSWYNDAPDIKSAPQSAQTGPRHDSTLKHTRTRPSIPRRLILH